ncbi:MAG: DUF4258 domain-containing protein [Nitrospirae bacterium]|nr:DUF4258 domain-containing protein [Nitrospirota bacterium]
MSLDDIKESIRVGNTRITDHADDEAQEENLLFDEIVISVQRGDIIEQYPDDKPYPSCLILGKNLKNEPIHSVWAYHAEAKSSVLITVYRPDPKRWTEDWKTRRKR